jgi:hypothetical protein
VHKSAFSHGGKTPEINNLEGEKVYFGSVFQRFQPMVGWLTAFGPMQGMHIMVGALGGGSCSPYSCWEAEERRKHWGSNIPFKGMPLVTSLLPISPHVLKVPTTPNSPEAGNQDFNTWHWDFIQTIAGWNVQDKFTHIPGASAGMAFPLSARFFFFFLCVA